MRKTRTYILILFIMLLLAHHGIGNVTAMETGFTTEAISEEAKDRIISNVNISLLTVEPRKEAICCFDVSENGMIAIGSDISEKKTISIYTEDGIFQYGYTYKDPGIYGIEWDKDNLIIYSVRGNFAVLVDPTGEVKEIRDIPLTTENDRYWHKVVFAKRRSVEDTQYILTYDFGILNMVASSYTRLVIVKPDGEETMFYDVNEIQFLKVIIVFIGVVFLIGIVISGIIKEIKKARLSSEQQ
ncbi:MAG: hypothetical protein HFE78_05105 [Clostridiales bacterium]|nr:hypothetical protein [Clostridiales bacterium]